MDETPQETSRQEYPSQEYSTDDFIADDINEYEDKTVIEISPAYSNQHSTQKIIDKTIRSDLEKLGLPQQILNTADFIYQNMAVGTKRGKRRKMLIFFCSFSAYNQENIPVDPVVLANKCGIERSDVAKALSMCSPVHTNFDTPLVRYSPENYIPVYFGKLNNGMIGFPDGALEEIYEMTREIIEHDSELNDEKPQTVAAAIIVYYLQTKGYVIDKDKYKSIFGRSDMTINKVKKRVMKAHNE